VFTRTGKHMGLVLSRGTQTRISARGDVGQSLHTLTLVLKLELLGPVAVTKAFCEVQLSPLVDKDLEQHAVDLFLL